MKKSEYYIVIFLFVLIILIATHFKEVTSITARTFNMTPKVLVPEKNEYALDKDYLYVQKTDSFIPYNRQDIMNILYTIFDNGYTSFTFYCPKEYTSCEEDIDLIGNDQNIVTSIGNFVHPYNNFVNLKVVTDSFGKIDVEVTKMYSDDQISFVNSKVDELLNEIDSNLSVEQKVRLIHDKIIERTEYDLKGMEEYGNAYKLFYDNKSKCSGYADALAIVLDKLNVPNYKVASDKHVWNGVYLNGKWHHIDLTWDDPITENKHLITEEVSHKFYMVDTNTLLLNDNTEHNFDDKIYKEMIN